MKKYFLKLTIFLAVVGVFNFAPKTVYAAACTNGNAAEIAAGCSGACKLNDGTDKWITSAKNQCTTNGKTWTWYQPTTAGANAAAGTADAAAATSATAAQQAPYKSGPCGITEIGCQLWEAITRFVGWIILVVMRLLSLLTILAGAILNYVIMYTIVDMSKHYSDIGAIKTSWSTIRDLANMTFIFILLYQAIRTIIGEGKETQKFVVNMIIAALLMNFSLFFTQLIIDASNILTLTFYKAIVVNYSPDDLLSSGLSNSIMQPLNLQSIWKISDTIKGTDLITIGVFGSVFTLIAAFVFFAIALLFIIRYVVLIFVLIFSPIFVVGSIIPGMKSYAEDWKKALTGQVTFAPIYMILTWVVVKIFNSCGFILGGQLVNGVCVKPAAAAFSNIANPATAGSAGTISLIINFIVVIVFLIATLIISKKLSESSSSYLS
ncbi:MAG: hypothetical protein WA048_03095, partial [Minisyncoccia bacterium]